MSDSGLRGIKYDAQPPRFNLENNSAVTAQINLNAEEEDNNKARPGNYTTMIKTSAPEKNSTLSFVSLLYPIAVTLDIPTVAVANTSQQQNSVEDKSSSQQNSVFLNDMIVRDLARIISLSTAIALIRYIVYRRIKRSKRLSKQQQ
jgi:hypothetical protein